MTLPDTASVGDSGHVTDHNLIVDELERLETDKLDVATATATYRALSSVGARVWCAGAFSLVHNTTTVVPFDAETFDTNAMHDNVTNNSRITVPAGKTGKWRIAASVGFAANGTGVRDVRVYQNGAIKSFARPGNAGAAVSTVILVADVLPASAGDYFEVFATQSSGVTLAVEQNQFSTYFTAEFLGT